MYLLGQPIRSLNRFGFMLHQSFSGLPSVTTSSINECYPLFKKKTTEEMMDESGTKQIKSYL